MPPRSRGPPPWSRSTSTASEREVAAAAATRGDDVTRGVAFAMGAILMFTALNALVKYLAARYPTVELVFFRSAIALLPTLWVVAREGGLKTLRTTRPVAHLLRSMAWLMSLSGMFIAVSVMPLAEVVSLTFTAPLFLVALSGPLLGETVGKWRWGAVLVGFLAVLVMARPGGDMNAVGVAAALGNAFFFSVGAMGVRHLSRTESSGAIVFYTLLLATLVSALALPFVWRPVAVADLAPLLAIGLFGGVGQYWMTQSFRYAPASALAPFNYVALVWAMLFGWAFFGDIPTATTLGGAAVVIASGLFILYRERRVARLNKPARTP